MSDGSFTHLKLNPESDISLIAQLSEQLTWLIASGELKAGNQLPPMRRMAEVLGVHMHTVRQAYQRLEADGLVSIRTRRGTVVQPIDPAVMARSTSESSTYLLGVILPNPGDFYSPFIRAIQEAAREIRYLPLFCYTFENPYLVDTYFNQLNARQVDGFIFAGIGPASLIEESQTLDLFPPIVSVDVPDMPGYRILIDTEGAAYQITKHLVDHGHQRIGLISPPLEWPNVTSFFQGYQSALDESGLALDPRLISVVEGFFDTHGREGAEYLLDLEQPPEAIVAAADILALGAMAAIWERGLEIPGDIALAGYNDIQAAALVQPGLTTASIPAAEMGSLAVHLLQELIKGKKPKRRTRILPTEQIIRHSCGC